MKIKTLNTFGAAVAALFLLTTPSVRAGTISVVNLPFTGTDAATGITTNKHYVCAIDYGNASGANTTNNINGVLFYHFAPNNTAFITNGMDTNFGGQFILSCSNSSLTNFTGKLNSTSSTSQGSPNNQADGNTRLILYDLMFVTASAPSNTWLHQEYDNLTVGDQYSLRVYYRFWGNTPGDRLINVAFNGEGTFQNYSANPLDEDAGTNGTCHGARYLEYDFTAASTNVLCYVTNLIGNGSMMIEAVTLEDDSFPFAPFITYQPTAVTVGSPTLFTVSAIGTGALSYQWYHNSVSNYSGASMTVDGSGYSGSTTTNLSATANLLDYYFVVVTNSVGSVTSSITQINPKPVITAQPSIAANVGVSVVYSITAGGFPPLSYQWYFNTASNYTGATKTVDGSGYSGSLTSSLTATTNLQDFYFVVVTNSYGSVTSTITAYNPNPAIAAQPTPFKAGSSVGFNVTASGWPALGYQWYFNTASNYSGTLLANGGGVSGATSASVTITNLLDYYFVVVTNYYGSTTSQVVRVAAPPTIVSAGEPIWNQTSQTNVVITFSDVLDPVTAAIAGNFSLNNGASVLSATVGGSNEVILATSVLTPGTSYTLTAANVNDYYGITMSPSPTNVIVGIYPANLALWVRADTGVTTDANGVNQWNDLSGNGNNLVNTFGAPFEPQLATNTLGDTVIRFSAPNETFLQASTSPTLTLTNDMSIIAVVNFASLDGGTNGMIVSKTTNGVPAPYDYYVTATNAGARLYRGNGTNFGQVTATGTPSVGTPHILAVTETGNTVSHFLDGVSGGSSVLNNGFNESSSRDLGLPLYVGTRYDQINRLNGDLSELIVAGSAISSYDVSALQTYLVQRHNLTIVNAVPANLGFSVAGNQLSLFWPKDHTGWRLQAQTNGPGAGISTNWFTVPNSTSTNVVVITISPTNSSVFYRMVYP